MLIVPGDAGEIGVLARHAPLVAMLKAGSTRIYRDRDSQDVLEFATGPGFFKVEQDRALALVDDAVDAREIDDARAREQLEDARAELERARARRVRRRPLAAGAASAPRREPARGLRPWLICGHLLRGSTRAPRSSSRPTRDLDRGRTTPEAVEEQVERDGAACVTAQQDAGLDLLADGMLRWQDHFRPLLEAADGLETGALTRFLDTNTFYRAPKATSATPKLGAALEERYLSPLPGPRLVTLPSPFALAKGTGVTPRTMAEGVLKPQLDALDAELVVLAEPFLAREESASLDDLSEALEALGGGPRLAIWFTFGDARSLLEQGVADLPVEGIGVDFYATHLGDVPDGFSKLLLAGVVDVRSSLLEEPRELAAFAQRLGERAERIALVPNGDLQYVSVRDRPREARSTRQGQGPRRRRPLHDRPEVPHPRGRLARQAALARQDFAGPQARGVRHRARPHLGREGGRRRARGARRVPPERRRRPGRGRALVEPLLRSHAGDRRGRGHLGRRAAAHARCTPGRSSTRTASSPAAPSAASTTSTTPSPPCRRAGLAARAVPQRRVRVPAVGGARPTSRSRSRAPTRSRSGPTTSTTRRRRAASARATAARSDDRGAPASSRSTSRGT